MPATIMLPTLAIFWLLSMIFVIPIDAVYVLLRAAPGESPDPAFHPYGEMRPISWWNTYAAYDHRYRPNDDVFVVVQAYLNLAELVIGYVAVTVGILGYHRTGLGMTIAVSIMTIYKTVIYFMMDIVDGGMYTNHNSFAAKTMMITFPASIWIVVPAMIVFQCFTALKKLEHLRPEELDPTVHRSRKPKTH